mmetsp:Transcript_21933/g.19478  ORF Transcript_21933/g.19478 Transcript_21933/m.19478 type:complete len:92 (+) Transcript_21933:546-821(+)
MHQSSKSIGCSSARESTSICSEYERSPSRQMISAVKIKQKMKKVKSNGCVRSWGWTTKSNKNNNGRRGRKNRESVDYKIKMRNISHITIEL